MWIKQGCEFSEQGEVKYVKLSLCLRCTHAAYTIDLLSSLLPSLSSSVSHSRTHRATCSFSPVSFGWEGMASLGEEESGPIVHVADEEDEDVDYSDSTGGGQETKADATLRSPTAALSPSSASAGRTRAAGVLLLCVFASHIDCLLDAYWAALTIFPFCMRGHAHALPSLAPNAG